MLARSDVQSAFQFTTEVFNGVEIRIRGVCRDPKTPALKNDLHGARLVHRHIIMLEQVLAD